MIRVSGYSGSPETPVQAVLEAAEALRAARVRYAESYLLHRLSTKSDGTAHQQAILETADELTVAQARYDLARWRLDHAPES